MIATKQLSRIAFGPDDVQVDTSSRVGGGYSDRSVSPPHHTVVSPGWSVAFTDHSRQLGSLLSDGRSICFPQLGGARSACIWGQLMTVSPIAARAIARPCTGFERGEEHVETKKHTNTYIHITSICRRWGGDTRSESKAGEIDIKNESRRKSARKTLHSWDPQEERRKPASKSKSGNKKSTRSHQKKGKTTLDRKRAGGEDRVSTEAPITSKGGTGRGGTRGKQKR
jgi:hypothetical protein